MINQKEVLKIVRATREISLPHWGNVVASSKSESPTDLVTEIDNRIEHFLKEKLNELYPTIPFVGEETGGNRDLATFWLCDPIDGTVHYVRGLPFCTTMLCLIENGTVVFSCIYHFVTDDMYSAVRGEGTYKNDTRLFVSNSKLNGAYIGLESNETFEGMTEMIRSIESNKCVIVKTINSGWEFSMVAEGKLDARIQIHPWGDIYDFAPGSLLVEEAGGVVKNIGSQTYDYKNLNFVATNKQIYSDIKLLNIL